MFHLVKQFGVGLESLGHNTWKLMKNVVCVVCTCVVAQRETQGRVQQGNSLSVSLRKPGSDLRTGEDTSRQKDMLS